MSAELLLAALQSSCMPKLLIIHDKLVLIDSLRSGSLRSSKHCSHETRHNGKCGVRLGAGIPDVELPRSPEGAQEARQGLKMHYFCVRRHSISSGMVVYLLLCGLQ